MRYFLNYKRAAAYRIAHLIAATVDEVGVQPLRLGRQVIDLLTEAEGEKRRVSEESPYDRDVQDRRIQVVMRKLYSVRSKDSQLFFLVLAELKRRYD
jgi:hypothetical protein